MSAGSDVAEMAPQVEDKSIEDSEIGSSAESANPWSQREVDESADSDSGSEYSQPASRGSLRMSVTHKSVSATSSRPASSSTSVKQHAFSPSPNRTSTSSIPSAHQDSDLDKQQGLESNAIVSSQQPPLSLVTSSSESSDSPSDSHTATEASTTIAPQPQSPASNYSGSASPPQTPTREISPMTPQGIRKSIESFASTALSETSLDYDHLAAKQIEDVQTTPRVSSMRHLRQTSSLERIQTQWGPSRQDTLFDMSKDEPLSSAYPEDNDDAPSHSSTPSVSIMNVDEEIWGDSNNTRSGSGYSPARRSSSGSEGIEVDWLALERTEEQEKEDKEIPEGMEDESTKFLLARLEQENAKFTSSPSIGVVTNGRVTRARSNTRPPSMALLKRLVSGKETPTIRYSLAADMPLPTEPPPMTELEFWAALVQDYPLTASRLPTLTTTKIRSGIPPPLRGVVWTSMAGARDKALEDAFEVLQHEKSPYEGIINKDVGRSFPGVELFRDAEGEGQMMLGRVLKCFSLHDRDIGYCQGLGFLVGPLLMNMGEKEAFCVLVRLMDHFALRPSFLPSLSGLHMRIFQFSTLLKQHQPELSDHLSELGVEPAYLSQWFLSCFAVTCPLPMLFRIYDVIFAEGANETVMRVALALFRRNEKKILESTEFEEVMQLLLGRSLWDCYGFSADELVDDFTSLGNIITHERLAELESQFENQSREAVGQSAGFLPDVQAAASRFLGRLWTPNHLHTPSKGSTSLSPSSAEKESGSTSGTFLRGNFLRRSPSKQNIGVLNENTGEDSTSSGSSSLASTAPTDPDVHYAARESQADTASLKSKAASVTQSGFNREQHDLHTQIEDLLMALTEAQREHAQLAALLQKEREERNDDHRAVRLLVNKLNRTRISAKENNRRSMPPPSKPISKELGSDGVTSLADKRRTLPARPRPHVNGISAKESPQEDVPDDMSEVLGQVQERLDTNARYSLSFETKAHLRSTLARTREQLATAEQNLKELTDRNEFAETSLMTFQGESESLRAEVEELRIRVNEEFRTRQKLELQVQNLEIQIKMEARSFGSRKVLTRAGTIADIATLNRIDTSGGTQSRSRQNSLTGAAPGGPGGLRELKLNRRDSSSSVASIRSMKSQRRTSTSPGVNLSPSPPTSMVLESPYEAPESPPKTDVAETPLPPSTSNPPPALKTQSTAAPSISTSESEIIDNKQANPAPTINGMGTNPAPTINGTGTSPAPASASLSVPQFHRTGFARRTSSLVAKEVFATAEHEPVTDEALLLELVNSKTAEAQARQEVDELKRSLNLQKRWAEDAQAQMKAEADAIREEVRKAQEDAKSAREEARRARQEVFDASIIETPQLTWPATPAIDSPKTESPVVGTPTTEAAKRVETPPATSNAAAAASAAANAVGGWLWGRRTASTAKATADVSPVTS